MSAWETITEREEATVNPPLSPLPGGRANFFQAFLGGGLIERGSLFNLAKCINGSKVS